MDPELFDPKMGYIPESTSLLGQLQAIFAEMEFGNAKYMSKKIRVKIENMSLNFSQFSGSLIPSNLLKP